MGTSELTTCVYRPHPLTRQCRPVELPRAQQSDYQKTLVNIVRFFDARVGGLLGQSQKTAESTEADF